MAAAVARYDASSRGPTTILPTTTTPSSGGHKSSGLSGLAWAAIGVALGAVVFGAAFTIAQRRGSGKHDMRSKLLRDDYDDDLVTDQG